MKKPRSDSKLKTLPEAQQRELADVLANGSLDQGRDWLSQLSPPVSSSISSISEWSRWWHLREQMRIANSTVETVLQTVIADHPEMDSDALFDVGQMLFSAIAIQTQDPSVWKHVQQLNLQRRQMQLDRDKFELLKRRADLADQTEATLNQTLTPEQREAKIRAIFGK